MPLISGGVSVSVVGRDRELRQLDSALLRAQAGKPQVGFVEGDAGSGKSALLRAFVDGHPEIADSCSRVACDAFEQELSFGTVSLVLGATVEASSPIEVGRRLLAWLNEAQVAAGAATVLIIDDVHWMDRLSVQAFRFALRRLLADLVMVILARRGPVDVDDWLGLTLDSEEPSNVRLGPLDESAIAELAAALRQWQLDEHAVSMLAERTGGVPLLVGAVLSEGTDRLDFQAGPVSAAAAARRILSGISPDARDLVEALAVLDEPTDLIAAGQVAAVPEPALAASDGLRSGLLVEPQPQLLVCSHSLLRDAVIGMMPPERVRVTHLRAAQWTSGERRLHHRAAAADRPDPVLVNDLVAAAETARGVGQFRLAAVHSGRARALSPPSAAKDRLLLTGMLDWLEAGAVARAGPLAQEVEQLPESGLKSLCLGRLARDQGFVGPAKIALARAAEQALIEGDDRLSSTAAATAAELSVAAGNGAEALAALGWVVAPHPDLAPAFRTLTAVALWQTGELPQALELLDEAPAVTGRLSWEPAMLSARGMIAYYAGRLPQAADDLDAALRLTSMWQPGVNYARTYVQRALTRYGLGDWDGATVDVAAALAVASEGPGAWSLPMAHAASVHVLAGRGQWDLAEEHLERAAAGLRTLHSTQGDAFTVSGTVLLAAARRDFTAVRAVVAPGRFGPRLSRLALVRAFRWVMVGWISATIEEGDLAEVDADLTEYQDMLRRWPQGPTPSRIGWLRGLLAEARDDPGTARQFYAEDLADPEMAHTPFIRAQVLHTAGRLEHALGHRREAIDHLQAAHVIFHGLRAAPYETRCAEDLAGCGLTSTSSGPNGLSQREQDVVALVARGLTNKEAAAELFVTAKTVEYHLGNVYAKLGIASRRDLRRLNPQYSGHGQD